MKQKGAYIQGLMIRSIFCLQEDGPITGWWGANKSVAGQRETSWPFTSMAEDLNPALPSTIPASVQSET